MPLSTAEQCLHFELNKLVHPPPPSNCIGRISMREYCIYCKIKLATQREERLCVGIWKTKTFLFKFYNNILGLNTRVSHFDDSVDRRCTICKINQSNISIGTTGNVVPVPVPVPAPIADESFKHMFLDCPTVRKLHDLFLNKYFNSMTFASDLERARFFFYGTVPGQKKYNIFVHASVMTFQYVIWQMKLKNRLLAFESLSILFMEGLLGFFCNNKEARKKSLDFNFPLCRSIKRLPAQDLAARAPPLARAPAAVHPPAFQAAPGIPPAPPWRH